MIIRTQQDDVLTLSLNSPETGNRIGPEMIHTLLEEYRRANPLDGGPAVIVLKAEGDLFSLGRQRPLQQSPNPADIVSEFSLIQELNEAVQYCRAVTVAPVHGRCEGAGLSLAARSDIVLIADDALVSFPEIPHGIPPTIVLIREWLAAVRALTAFSEPGRTWEHGLRESSKLRGEFLNGEVPASR